MKKIILSILLTTVLFSRFTTANSNADSIEVIVQNIKTGKRAPWKYTLSLYIHGDSITTNTRLSKKAISDIGPGKHIGMKLEMYNHNFVCQINSNYLYDPVALVFKLNIDLENNEKCNKTYWTKIDGETLLITSYNGSAPAQLICDRAPSEYQSLQIQNSPYQFKRNDDKPIDHHYPWENNDMDDSFFDWLDTFDGYYANLNGTYKASVHDSTYLVFELTDSAIVKMQLRKGQEILKAEMGTWVYDSDFEMIHFYMDTPVEMELPNGETLHLDSCSLRVQQEPPLYLRLDQYQVKEDKIVKSEPFQLMKE